MSVSVEGCLIHALAVPSEVGGGPGRLSPAFRFSRQRLKGLDDPVYPSGP